MDPVKILKRAWYILWNYRVLWIFGFILALTASSGSSGGSGNNGLRFNANEREEFQMPSDMQREFNSVGEAFDEIFNYGLPALERELDLPQGELNTMLWVGVAFIIVMMVFGVLMSVARYVSEASLIRMVDEYEASGTKKTFRECWRLGWSRTAWRLFLIDLLVSLPFLIMLAFFVMMGFAGYRMVSAPGAGDETWAGMIGIIGVSILVLFVVVLVSVFLRLLRHFFWRSAALENLGVRDSLRAGFQMARENWKDIGIMWLVMIGVGIASAIVSFVAFIISLPLIVVTVVAGAIVAAVPGALLAGFFSLFLSGYLPWIAGGLFVMPLFFIVGFSPWVLLSGWSLTYISTVWTLVYRELKALPGLAPDVDDEIMQLDA